MQRRRFRATTSGLSEKTCVWGILLLCAGIAKGTLVVDPPMPTTHLIEVQIIRVFDDVGANPATIFGNVSQQTAIEAAVDTIWSQAGVDVNFLPTINTYNDSFALLGSISPRPQSDLDTMMANADAEGGILNLNPDIMNMFFVDIVPGSSFTSELTVNGLARVGTNGIAQFVGDTLLTFGNGLDSIASVVSHEIGHNLGLKHPAGMVPNLMSPGGGSEQLSTDQISAIFQTTSRDDAVAFIPSGGTGLLTLVPEPSTITLFLLSVPLVLLFSKRKTIR